jgi:hypothetical protein
MQNGIAIGPMTKVSLIISAFAVHSTDGAPQANIQFEFVYGIGKEGLSAFEKELHGLSVGTRLKIRPAVDEMKSYFEHLRCPLLEAVKIQPPFDLTIDVQSVTPVTNRELVHALANRDVGGCGCDCGCGC